MTRLFDLEDADSVTVVSFVGPKVTPEFEDPLLNLVGGEKNQRVLLDLGNVCFLSSNALGILMRLKRNLDAAGGRLRICGLAPDLRELFRLTKMDDAIELFEGRQEAVREF